MQNKYYQKKNKGKLQKEAREWCQNFTEEEKEKKPQYYCDRNKNLSEDQ